MVEHKYTVTGMTCQHCVNAVTEEISEIDGVRTVEVDLATGKVVVLSDQPLTDDAVSAAVTEAGYTLAS
jgi:copper chaperone